MLRFYTLLLVILGSLATPGRLLACYADFDYNNACPGDTIWLNALYEFGGAYSWNFGDTNPDAVNVGYGTNVYHVYTQQGSYNVTLFVNIGAEWAYQTQIIEVGSACFAAGFSTECQQYAAGTMVNFTNQSVGNITTWQWNFGDPATPADTSSLQHPYYVYGSPGTYTVTLTVSDGVNTATAYQTVTITDNSNDYCIGASLGFNYYTTDCLQDTTAFNVTYWGNISAYYWDFGDPASGIFNFSTQQNPTHLYTAEGTYIVTLIIANAYTADTIYHPVYVGDCSVWPGDFNNDGQVTVQDLFPIGLYYNATGPARPEASAAWTGQTAPDWTDFTSFMYLQKLVNGKHADGNGDGTLNAADIALIAQNYGLRHTNQNTRQAYLGQIPPTAPHYLFNLPTCCPFDETGTLMLGVALSESGYYYGGSFTIHFNPGVVDAQTVQFITDVPGLLTVQHLNADANALEIAYVRTDKTYAVFDGNLGQLRCGVKGGVAFGTPMLLSISDAMLLNNGVNTWQTNQQFYVPVNENPEITEIAYTATPAITAPQPQFTVYPTVVHNGAVQVAVQVAGQQNLQISVYNAAGQPVYTTPQVSAWGNYSAVLPLHNLPQGVYMVTLKTNTQTSTHKIVKTR
ncbi:PKD domain-containing protein [Sphingobacteriales bacterium UPWRP_1]|nr:hypothetical protein BVG80_12430 [Sphingobacteriales bacterium TSM_CSM]PSJ77836.1 PKD domain-containing protein [Sphingobacteriales bacterium UPWRP_1]